MNDQFIGNYRVVDKVGAGGMAKVYLGVHKDVANLKVVLKILSDPRLVERFRQEADKLAVLDGHPNVCRIKDFFTHGDETVIAMEYIEGQSVEERLKTDGRIPIDESVKIVSDVLDVLHFAHGNGIYHRDIKPSNIMIDKSGQVKIIDFGIAKSESDPNLTTAGAMCGTPLYMAPEQFTQADGTDYAKVDIYAAGTTLYHMLTGKLPFVGDNEFILRDAKLATEPPLPRSINPGISKVLENIILKSIDRDPENRFSSPAAMRRDLMSMLSKDATPQEKTREVSVAPRSSSSGLPVKKITMGVAGVLVAAVVVFVIMQFMGGEPDAPELRLLTPADGHVFTETSQPSLSWQDVVGEGGSYILEFASDTAFSDARTLTGLSGGSYTFVDVLKVGSYYWRIYPVGDDGRLGDKSAPSSFEIDFAAPVLATGTLSIDVSPSGDISIDGERVASSAGSASQEVDTGRHVIKIENSRSRQKWYVDTVAVAGGETVQREYAFTFPQARVEEKFGEARVGSRPRGASVYIDGDLQPQKTNYTFKLKPGRHIIKSTMTLDGREIEHVDTVRIVADSSLKVLFDFE